MTATPSLHNSEQNAVRPSIPSRLKRCRICGNSSLISCVPMGSQYLSSVFPSSLNYRKEVPCWPLDLVICEKTAEKSTCGLVQLGHQFDLSVMYNDYPYTSSTNSSMPSVLKEVAESGRTFGHLRKRDLIVDIGGNDGTLLSFFQNQGFDLLNIDPASNLKPILVSPDYLHIRNFFSHKVFVAATDKKARLIFSIAMFYHLPGPIRFANDVATCLDDEGIWIIQMAYLPAMLRTNMYDNIVHEHNGYYAAHQIKWIMEKVGLEVFDVTLNAVYGGSFRVFVKKKGCARYPVTQRYHEILQKEAEEGIFDLETYQGFTQRIKKTKDDLRELCKSITAVDKKIWVYGASTKGNTILQYCGLGKNDIVAAADANPFKLGKYMVGADILIKDEVTMRAAKPDYLLVLPYSFLDAFMKREAELISRGTKFIVPLPQVRTVP